MRLPVAEDPIQVVLEDGEQCLEVAVKRRAYPEAHDYWDGNWLFTTIEVRTPSSKARYDATLRTDEFDAFRQDLVGFVGARNDQAAFQSTEEWLAIRVLRDDDGAVAEITFRSGERSTDRIDQSLHVASIRPTTLLEQVSRVLTAFPVIENPND